MGKKGVGLLVVMISLLLCEGVMAEDIDVEINSQGCSADKCFIKPGRNEFTFSAPAQISYLYYRISNSPPIIKKADCEGSTCTGSAVIECGEGEAREIAVVNPRGKRSVDDQENQLKGNKALVCDSNPPRLTGDGVSLSNDAGKFFLKSYDTIVIKAIVDEQNPDKIVADLKELGGEEVEGSCVRMDDHQECSVTAAAPKGPIGDASIPVKIYDLGGNSLSYTLEDIIVLEASNVDIDAWKASAINIMPDRFNRDLLEYYQKKVLVNFKIRNRLSGYEVLEVVPKDCRMIGQEGIRIDQDHLFLDFDPRNHRATLEMNLDSKYLPRGMTDAEGNTIENYEFNCTIEIMTKKENMVVEDPEEESFRVRVRTYHTTLWTEELQEAKEKELEEIKEEKARWERLSDTFQDIRTACSIVDMTEQAAGVLGTIASSLPSGPAESTAASAESTHTVARVMDKTKVIGGMCEHLSCRKEYNTIAVNAMDSVPGWGEINEISAQAAGLEDPNQLIDPYESQFTAIMSLCAPAWVHNKMKKVELSCERLRCLNEDVSQGFPISACNEAYGYMECKYTWGGWTKYIPFVGLGYQAFESVVNIAKDPFAMMLGVSALLCRGNGNVWGLCAAKRSIDVHLEKVQQFTSMAKSMKQLFEDRPVPDYCSSVMEGPAFMQNPEPNPFEDPGIFSTQPYCDDSGMCYKRTDGRNLVAQGPEGEWYEVVSTPDVFEAQQQSGRIVDALAEYEATGKPEDFPAAYLRPVEDPMYNYHALPRQQRKVAELEDLEANRGVNPIQEARMQEAVKAARRTGEELQKAEAEYRSVIEEIASERAAWEDANSELLEAQNRYDESIEQIDELRSDRQSLEAKNGGRYVEIMRDYVNSRGGDTNNDYAAWNDFWESSDQYDEYQATVQDIRDIDQSIIDAQEESEEAFADATAALEDITLANSIYVEAFEEELDNSELQQVSELRAAHEEAEQTRKALESAPFELPEYDRDTYDEFKDAYDARNEEYERAVREQERLREEYFGDYGSAAELESANARLQALATEKLGKGDTLSRYQQKELDKIKELRNAYLIGGEKSQIDLELESLQKTIDQAEEARDQAEAALEPHQLAKDQKEELEEAKRRYDQYLEIWDARVDFMIAREEYNADDLRRLLDQNPEAEEFLDEIEPELKDIEQQTKILHGSEGLLEQESDAREEYEFWQAALDACDGERCLIPSGSPPLILDYNDLEDKVEDAEEALDSAEADVDEAEDIIEDSKESISSKHYWEGQTSFWSRYASGMRFAHTAHSISTLVYPEQDFGDYTRALDRAFGWALGKDTYFEDQACLAGSSDINPVQGSLMIDTGGHVRSAAHIEGHKDGPDNEGKYSYLITGAVIPQQNDPFGEGFDVEVKLKGDGTHTARKYSIVEEANAEEEDTVSKRLNIRNDPITLRSDKNYDTVCIRFLDDYGSYFTQVDLDNHELCNVIEGG